jgi:hypothetical protein
MRRSLIAMAAVLLSGVIGGANQTPPVVQPVIHATPEKVKKAALAMFVPDGFTIDLDTASQLKISRPFSSERPTLITPPTGPIPQSQIAAASIRSFCRRRITQSMYQWCGSPFVTQPVRG